MKKLYNHQYNFPGKELNMHVRLIHAEPSAGKIPGEVDVAFIILKGQNEFTCLNSSDNRDWGSRRSGRLHKPHFVGQVTVPSDLGL